MQEYRPLKLPTLVVTVDEDAEEMERGSGLTFKTKWDAILDLKRKRMEDIKLSKSKPLRCTVAGCYFRTDDPFASRRHIAMHDKYEQYGAVKNHDSFTNDKTNVDTLLCTTDEVEFQGSIDSGIESIPTTDNDENSNFFSPESSCDSCVVAESEIRIVSVASVMENTVTFVSNEEVLLECAICSAMCEGEAAAVKHAKIHVL